MVKVQVTLTPNEAKRLIAKAVSQMPLIREALKNGKILLKGGTTVSAVTEELVGRKLPISGRITPKGTKGSITGLSTLHRLLLDRGEPKGLETESDIEEAAVQMGKKDAIITGANALDVNRKAAIMMGRPLGGPAGLLPKIIARGIPTIITVGWEKLIPCPIEEAIAEAGNESIDMAMGMTVGLIPLLGRVVTETDAVSMLTGVKTTVIGAGGVEGGEGSTTFVMAGKATEVREAWKIVQSVKGAELSGVAETLVECHPGCPFCGKQEIVGSTRIPTHRGCAYFRPELAVELFSEQEDSDSK
jgi:hypothetical protein